MRFFQFFCCLKHFHVYFWQDHNETRTQMRSCQKLIYHNCKWIERWYHRQQLFIFFGWKDWINLCVLIPWKLGQICIVLNLKNCPGPDARPWKAHRIWWLISEVTMTSHSQKFEWNGWSAHKNFVVPLNIKSFYKTFLLN
jgi:hypothetical protein